MTVLSSIDAVPIGVIRVFSPQLLKRSIPQADLAQNAGSFLQWSLIGILGYANFETGKQSMQTQENFTGVNVLLISLPINIFLKWLPVYYLGPCTAAAALAATLTSLVRPLILLLYAIYVAPQLLQFWPKKLAISAVLKEWDHLLPSPASDTHGPE